MSRTTWRRAAAVALTAATLGIGPLILATTPAGASGYIPPTNTPPNPAVCAVNTISGTVDTTQQEQSNLSYTIGCNQIPPGQYALITIETPAPSGTPGYLVFRMETCDNEPDPTVHGNCGGYAAVFQTTGWAEAGYVGTPGEICGGGGYACLAPEQYDSTGYTLWEAETPQWFATAQGTGGPEACNGANVTPCANLGSATLNGQGSGSAASPCTLNGVNGNFTVIGQPASGNTPVTMSDGTNLNGQYFDAGVDLSGGADALVAVDDNFPTWYSTHGKNTAPPTYTLFGKTFTGDEASGTGVTADTNAGSNIPVPATISMVFPQGETINPHLWCHYGGTGGTWVDLGQFSTYTSLPGSQNSGTGTITPPEATALSACLSAGNWSLWNPGSWIPGGLKDAECILKFLFVPSICPSNGATCVSLDTTALTTKAPLSYISDATAALSTIANGFTNAAATSACAAPTFTPFANETSGLFAKFRTWTVALPAPTELGCTNTGSLGTDAGNLFGYRPWIRALILFGMTLGFIALLWNMAPWSSGNGGGPDVVEIIGKVGDTNLYSDGTAGPDKYGW